MPHSRTPAVQTAWFNGAGVHTWENVFGIFNQLTPRVAAGTKAVAALLRGLGPLLQGRGIGWRPHAPVTTRPLLFASEFVRPAVCCAFASALCAHTRRRRSACSQPSRGSQWRHCLSSSSTAFHRGTAVPQTNGTHAVWTLVNTDNATDQTHGPTSRRRDYHFADIPSPSILKHLLKGEGCAAE